MIAIRITVVLVVAVLAIVSGYVIALDTGHVVVQFRGWEVEMSVWAGVAALIAIFTALVLLIRLLRYLLLKPSNVANWFSGKRARNAERQTFKALEAETNGDSIEAIRLLSAAGEQSSTGVLHFLRASELAGRIGASEKAHELRRRASQSGNGALKLLDKVNDAIEQLEHGDKRQGLRALSRLLEVHPRCAPALVALISHCREIGDWTRGLEYLDVLSRLTYMNEVELHSHYVACWIGRFGQVEPTALHKTWREVPRALRHDAEVLLAYIKALIDHGQKNQAAHELEREIKREWSGPLVRAYGCIEADAEKQLKIASAWHNDHPDDADLELTRGRLHCRLEQSDEAAHHFERSVRLSGNAEARLELAELQLESGVNPQVKETLAYLKQDLVSK